MPIDQRPRRKRPVEHDPRALREARIRRGLLQGQVARAVGMTQSVLCEAEHGTRGLTPPVRNRLARVLQCDPITFAPLRTAA